MSKQVCKDCGCTDWRLLENDHVNDDKSRKASGKTFRTISKNATLTKIKEELDKCEAVCIKCHRIRTHSRFTKVKSDSGFHCAKKIRREIVDEDKLKREFCELCQFKVTKDNTFLFDYDHIDPTTKVKSISDMGNHLKSISSIKKELEKCRLLCCSCHRLFTREKRKWTDVTKATPDELTFVDNILKGKRNLKRKENV